MRGKVYDCGKKVAAGGITPAYAGKRCSDRPQLLRFEDHPRLCGEKLTSSKIYGINWGSPPPMRGKGHGENSGGHKYWDHPRLCGEKVQRTAEE